MLVRPRAELGMRFGPRAQEIIDGLEREKAGHGDSDQALATVDTEGKLSVHSFQG